MRRFRVRLLAIASLRSLLGALAFAGHASVGQQPVDQAAVNQGVVGQGTGQGAVDQGAVKGVVDQGVPVTELLETRLSYLAYWQELSEGNVVGLERFARTVQRVVDTRAREHHGGKQAQRLILDDLVDLFVSADYLIEKQLVMSTRSVLGEDALSEESLDLASFAPPLRAGEGRYRHFALNAAAAYSAPDALVDLAARLRGGDVAAESADSQADLATNRIGRSFARLLRERPLAELAGSGVVREWLAEHFGAGE